MNRPPILQNPHLWAFTTYFAEGLPYTLIRTVSSVFFRDMKVSLEAIGLTSLFGVPWILKFLWGPQIDQFGTKRRWMLVMQFLLIVLILAVAFLADFPWGVKAISLLLFAGAFVAATHDMAIDGYYMEALDEKGQARFVGYRVMAYRIAMMTGTGVVVTLGALWGWPLAYLAGSFMLVILFLYHVLWLPRVEEEKRPIGSLVREALKGRSLRTFFPVLLCMIGLAYVASLDLTSMLPPWLRVLGRISISGWIGMGLLAALCVLAFLKNRIRLFLLKDPHSFYTRAFAAYVDRERIGVTLAFIILLRAGESMLTAMVSPFLVDLGIKLHYGWISAGVGLPCSIVGAMLGGWLISKYTLRRTIWPFLLAQNLTNLVYMVLALHLSPMLAVNTGAVDPAAIGNLNLFLVASVHGFDQFSGGLGTAVLVTFVMRTCLPEFKAAHFAIGTGLMNISAVLSGVMSGFLAEWIGYGYFFGVSFVVSVPGMILALFVPLDAAPADAAVDG
ncbi:MAG: MFS transporter [Deltaproteobacteria bacterium]|nr:MFS transporter [Deltaproteobacteria bacterium]